MNELGKKGVFSGKSYFILGIQSNKMAQQECNDTLRGAPKLLGYIGSPLLVPGYITYP